MRVLVCGGRDFDDEDVLFSSLNQLNDHLLKYFGVKITVIIEGDAHGADKLAGKWADTNAVEKMVFPAEWKMHGKSAGAIRNRKMIVEGRPNLVLAFPGGSGTTMMINMAKDAKISVIRVQIKYELVLDKEGLDIKTNVSF